MKKRQLLLSFLLLPFLFITTSSALPRSMPDINQQKILANASNLSSRTLSYAIKGYTWALEHHQVNNPNVLTVIDFSLPSNVRRMWVIDLRNSRVLMNLFTTQGKDSGDIYAEHFSNEARTDETSLGVYRTLNAYYGAHGLSERLQGLEAGINNNALQRDIVIHPAWYASPSFVAMNHRAGLSWGCFAINPADSRQFVDLTKNGSVIFAYASQENHDRNLYEI